MNNLIVPAYNQHIPKMLNLLNQKEEWHILALDSLSNQTIKLKQNQWFIDVDAQTQKIQGVLYRENGLIHIGYNQLPYNPTALYTWLLKNGPFVTHGHDQLLRPLLGRLAETGLCDVRCIDRAYYLKQTPQTEQIIQQSAIDIPKHIKIRLAEEQHLPELKRLYQATSVEHLIDLNLIKQLVKRRRILLALVNNQVAGTIMILKESNHYALLGGLFVADSFRKKGIATMLAFYLLKRLLKGNKKICFYYHDKALQQFYSKGAFRLLGYWSSYQITSKRVI